MKDVRIVVEIYIYLLLEYRNDKMNKETNCSRECYGIHTRHQPRTRRVNIRMSVVFSFTYVCICTRVRVISQMIAFCARPRKYAKLRQRLPPFSTIFNARGKSRIESKYWKKKKVLGIRSIHATCLMKYNNEKIIRMRILPVERIA